MLHRQTEIEEANARDWSPPTGDVPVYTQDWVSRNEPVFRRLLGHLKDKPDVEALEIGSFEGRSAVWFLTHILTDQSASITCVDLFDERLDQYFDHNIGVSGVGDKVIKRKGKSQEVLRGMPRRPEFDFIYVDGCHLATCTLADAVLAWDLLEVGGVMIFDDYTWNEERPPVERPKAAVDAFVAVFEPHLEVVERGNALAIRKTSEAY
jgi:predicted O-methyltransferase YrrM